MAATVKQTVVGLDVGSARIGVAIASLDARLPHPLVTLINSETFLPDFLKVLDSEAVTTIVVGWPRNLSGEKTAQTRYVEQFVQSLRQHTELPIYFQDEALTSKKAEAELQARRTLYNKGDVDALAAVYILEDYLAEA